MKKIEDELRRDGNEVYEDMWNTIPYNTSTILRESEEIIFLRIRENRTEITEHIGRSNSQINVHFTIQDSPSFLSTLTIHGRDYV